jgi:hypothetical protein
MHFIYAFFFLEPERRNKNVFKFKVVKNFVFRVLLKNSFTINDKSDIELEIDSIPVLGKQRYLIKADIPVEDFSPVTNFLHDWVHTGGDIPIIYLANHIGVAPKTASNWIPADWIEPIL